MDTSDNNGLEMLTAFAPVASPNAKILILGTFPSEQSLALQQYYAHAQNQFWPLLFGAYNLPVPGAYADKIAFLKAQRLALWDVLQFCTRQGSADSAIQNGIANDFKSFYDTHPYISQLFFTSQRAWQFYVKHVDGYTRHQHRILPSPSPAYASKTFEEKLKGWREVFGPKHLSLRLV